MFFSIASSVDVGRNNTNVGTSYIQLRVGRWYHVLVVRVTPMRHLSRQSEKFLIGQSRTFLLTARKAEGWNGLR